jgi:hypothetical protein
MQEDGVRTLPRVWETFQSRLSILFDSWRRHGENVRRVGRDVNLHCQAGATWWSLYGWAMTMREMLGIVESHLPEARGLDESGVPMKDRWESHARKVIERVSGMVGTQLDPPAGLRNRVVFAHTMNRPAPLEEMMSELEREADRLRVALHPLKRGTAAGSRQSKAGAQQKGKRKPSEPKVLRTVRWIRDAIYQHAKFRVDVPHREKLRRSFPKRSTRIGTWILYDIRAILKDERFRSIHAPLLAAIDGPTEIFSSMAERNAAKERFRILPRK